MPQGPPRRAGQRLPLVPRLQRLRQLAGVGRVGRGRALVLLPAEAAEVRRLPHAAASPSNDPAAKNGMIRSHRFAGRQHRAAVRQQGPDAAEGGRRTSCKDGQVTVDVFGLVRAPTTPRPVRRGDGGARSEPRSPARSPSAKSRWTSARRGPSSPSRAEVIAPLDKVDAVVRRGESVRVEVVVRTRKVGHFFPGGTVDAFDVWVELEAVDDNGRTIFHSGARRGRRQGPGRAGRALLPQPAARRARQPDQQAQRLGGALGRLRPADPARRRRHRPLPAADSPGRGRSHHAQGEGELPQVRLVEHAVGVCRRARSVAARDFALGAGPRRRPLVFTGDTSKVSGDIKAIPDIPITVMADGDGDAVGGRRRSAALPDAKPFLRQERPRALERLRHRPAAAGRPQGRGGGVPEGHRDGARLRGRLGQRRARAPPGRQPGRRPRRCCARRWRSIPSSRRRISSSARRSRRWAATTRRSTHLRDRRGAVPARPRRAQPARPRAVPQAPVRRRRSPSSTQVLAIDPEDLQAHYNLMLCLSGARRHRGRGARRSVLYERFKADESSQAITGPYRQLHPDDNNERQQIHEHRGASAPVKR